MKEFSVLLAEIPIDIRVNFDSTEYFLREYITEKKGIFGINVTTEDIEYEKAIYRENEAKEGICSRNYPDEYLETLSLYRKIAEIMPFYNVFLIHGAAVAYEDEAYLFTARSGVGKTTHVQNWLKVFKDNCKIINGDKPLIKISDKCVYVCGTPWQGKENYGNNLIVPLKSICVLKRGNENRIAQAKYSNEISTLLPQIYKSRDARSYSQTIELFERMTRLVPLYKLECTKDKESAVIAYNMMK